MSTPLDFSAFLGELPATEIGPEPARDNADPHPVILNVHPREWRIPYAHEWEAEYEIEVEHPSTCSEHEEDCAVADYLLNVGIDESFYEAFPKQDDLTDDELAVLDGTVRFVTISRWGSSWSTPDGTEYDIDFEFTWTDDPITEKNGHLL